MITEDFSVIKQIIEVLTELQGLGGWGTLVTVGLYLGWKFRNYWKHKKNGGSLHDKLNFMKESMESIESRIERNLDKLEQKIDSGFKRNDASRDKIHDRINDISNRTAALEERTRQTCQFGS